MVVETPQLSHATLNLFSKPASMAEFLAVYRNVAKDDIRHNHGNIAERLGFQVRLIHGYSRGAWLKELKTTREVVDYP